MADADVTERLAAIERRLDRLESLLATAAARPAVPIPPPAAVDPRLVTIAAAAKPATVPPPPPVPPRGTLEQTIGLRWAGWVGAIAVVIGAGLGIDFAYRQGWFAGVSPAVRVGALVAVAVALIGAGEVVYRRVSVWSAVGLYAAGVAVLFLAAYAGHAFYGLYGRGTAYALMGLATVAGAAVARRGDLVSIAAVAIVGGNLAPAILHAGPPTPVPFLSYLLTLQVVAVALAWQGGRKWWALRGLSLATTAGWAATAIPLPTFAGSATVAFLVAFAAVYHAERIASAAAAADEVENAGSVAFGAAVTALLVAGLLYLSRGQSASFRTGEVLAMAAATAGLAAACRRAAAAVAVGFGVQAAGLVVLAVPVAVSGASVTVGWGVLAVVLAVTGRWAVGAAVAAPVVWVLAAVDLLLWADGIVGDGAANRTVATVGGQAIPAYVVTAWGLAVAGHVVARLTRRRERVEQRAEVASAVDGGAAVVFVAASWLGLATTGATAAVLAYAAGATLAAVPAGVVTAVAVVAAVRWMAVDAVWARPDRGATWTTAALGGGVVAVLIGLGWVQRHSARPGRRALRVFTVVAGVWAATVVVDAAFAGRGSALAEQVAVSVLWASAAAAVVVAGFGRRLPDLRYAGLALFAVTLLKVVAVDLSGVGAGWRILSFLGLGGLLLATSVVYGRLGGGGGHASSGRSP